mmetsp:Transcript_75136/g.243151  ORF Transcript_75136/g.243151 Transcript_75136/m.243151 type:complete len:396 (+) Transcript_75136:406-1593(+)
MQNRGTTRLVDASRLSLGAAAFVPSSSHQGVCHVGHMPVRLQPKPSPMALCLLPGERASFSGEVASSQHRRGACHGVLEQQCGPDGQGVQGSTADRRLQSVAPLEEHLAQAALHVSQSRLPIFEVHGQGMSTDTDHSATGILGRAVLNHDMRTLLAKRELLAHSRRLVAVELPPSRDNNTAISLLGNAIDGALPLLGPEGAHAAAQHGDRRVLLHVPQLLHQAVGLGLVVGVEARDEVAVAMPPTFADRGRDATLAIVFHELHVGMLVREPPQDGKRGVVRGILDEDHLVASRSDAHLRLDGPEAIHDEELRIAHRHQPRHERSKSAQLLGKCTLRRSGGHTSRGQIVRPVRLRLQQSVQASLGRARRLHALEIGHQLLQLPPDLSRQFAGRIRP